MLNITNNILMSFYAVDENKDIVNTSKLKRILVKSFFDSAIVSGIVFFSTLVGIGYVDIWENIKIALVSSIVSGGLSFFSEVKKGEKEVFPEDENN